MTKRKSQTRRRNKKAGAHSSDPAPTGAPAPSSDPAPDTDLEMARHSYSQTFKRKAPSSITTEELQKLIQLERERQLKTNKAVSERVKKEEELNREHQLKKDKAVSERVKKEEKTSVEQEQRRAAATVAAGMEINKSQKELRELVSEKELNKALERVEETRTKFIQNFGDPPKNMTVEQMNIALTDPVKYKKLILTLDYSNAVKEIQEEAGVGGGRRRTKRRQRKGGKKSKKNKKRQSKGGKKRQHKGGKKSNKRSKRRH